MTRLLIAILLAATCAVGQQPNTWPWIYMPAPSICVIHYEGHDYSRVMQPDETCPVIPQRAEAQLCDGGCMNKETEPPEPIDVIASKHAVARARADSIACLQNSSASPEWMVDCIAKAREGICGDLRYPLGPNGRGEYICHKAQF